MPGGDRTGPFGAGPMTGRGAGYCGGNPAPGFATAPGGFGLGRGRGQGRGWRRRNRFFATGLTGWQRAAAGEPAFGPAAGRAAPAPSDEAQITALKQQAAGLSRMLDDLNRRIAELEGPAQEEPAGSGD